MSKRKKRNKASAPKAAPPPKRWVLPVVCYVLAFVLYVGSCTLAIIQDSSRIRSGAIRQQELTLSSFSTGSIQVLDNAPGGEERFVSTDEDPQLLYYNVQGVYITQLTFDAVSHKPGGEIVLYYNTRQDQGAQFSEWRKVWATQAADGSWRFDLGGKKIYALRLDPDTAGGVIWTVRRIAFNDYKPAVDYYLPSVQPLFLLLILPGLVAAGIAEGKNILQWGRALREAKK